MPYIDKKRRDTIVTPETCGELNYMVTELLIVYMKNNGLSYQTCNDIVGALDNAKDEFRRRVQHPYENIKIKQNSDVYDLKISYGLKGTKT